jgi:hypothetical protein
MAQVSKVMFSYHAAQRLNQRFGSRVTTEQDVDISTTFKKAGLPYRQNNGPSMVQAYVPRDQSVRMAMLVAIDTRCVLTVLNEGPVLDAIYRKIAH